MPKNSTKDIGHYIIGIVIGFQFFGNKLNEDLDEDTTLEKNRITKCSLQYVPTSSQASSSQASNQTKNIQVLGIWYECNEDKTLRPCPNIVKSTVDLRNYVTNMKAPISQKKTGGNVTYILAFEFLELKKELGIKPTVSNEN